LGVEPIALMRSAMELCHAVTLAQIAGRHAEARWAEEREAIEGWANGLTAGQLHRLWQLLLKGHEEVRTAPDPLVAAQMALLRVMHAADMPDPDKLAKKLEELASRPSSPAALPGETGPAPAPESPPWEAVVEMVERAGQLALANTMRMQVRVVELGPALLRFSQPPGFREDISPELRDGLLKVTGQRWQVDRVGGEGTQTLVERGEAEKASAEDAMRRAPLVEAALAAFPGAEFVNEEEDAPYVRGNRNWSQKR
jgi:DNA polymerase-3 subunit gamma/tau